MDLKLDDGTTVALDLVKEKNDIVITSTIGNMKKTEIVFFPDGRKYLPGAGVFKEMK